MSPSSVAQLSRGDVLIVRFPFSDLASDKRRPAILLTDTSVVSGPDGHFVFVGSSVPPAGEGFVAIQAGTPEAGAMGLRFPAGQTMSYIRPYKIATLDVALVTRKLGSVPPATLGQIDSLVRFALGL